MIVTSTRRLDSPAADPSTRSASFADRLHGLCVDIARPPELAGSATRMLALCVEATGAARASLMTLNPATGRLAIAAAVGLPDELIGRDVQPRPRSIAEWVFRNRRGLVLNGEVRDQRFESTDAGAHIESALSIPIETTQGVVGVLNLARHSPAPVFDDDEMAALSRSLAPVAEAIERVHRQSLGIRVVRDLERSPAEGASPLVPQGTCELNGFEMSLFHRPSAGGGCDGCDRVPHASGGQSLLAFDPAGTGPRAAAAAAFTQGLFAAIAAPERSAAGIVARLNAELHQRLGERRFVALWAAQLTGKGELAYCNAGFAAPLWVPGDGNPIARLDRGGPVAGAFPRSRFEEECIRLLAGDLILLASDGVIDARGTSDQPFGFERLAEVVGEQRRQPLERITAAVAEAVFEFSGRPVPTDDVTLFALRYTPGN